MPRILSLHWVAVADTIVLSSISIGQNSSAIDRKRAFVGFVDGNEGSEMCPGSSRDSIGAVHSDLVTPMLELFDDLSGVVPKFVGAAAAPVRTIHISNVFYTTKRLISHIHLQT